MKIKKHQIRPLTHGSQNKKKYNKSKKNEVREEEDKSTQTKTDTNKVTIEVTAQETKEA